MPDCNIFKSFYFLTVWIADGVSWCVSCFPGICTIIYVTAICKIVLSLVFLQRQRKGTEILELEFGNGMRLVASSIMVLKNRPGGVYQHQGPVWSMGNIMQEAFESLHCHQVTVKPTGEVRLTYFNGQAKYEIAGCCFCFQIEKQRHFCPIIPPQTKSKHEGCWAFCFWISSSTTTLWTLTNSRDN